MRCLALGELVQIIGPFLHYKVTLLNVAGAVIRRLHLIAFPVRKLRLEHVGVDSEPFPRNGAQGRAKPMRCLDATQAGLAECFGEAVAMQVRRVLLAKWRENKPASTGKWPDSLDECERLAWQRNDMRTSGFDL